MSDGLFNLSIALVCFCYSLKNNRFDVLIFHQFIFSMQFSRNNFQALYDLQPVALNLFISNGVRNQTHLRNSDERVSIAYECQA